MKTTDNNPKEFSRRTPFVVPEGYFESLSRQIIDAAECETAVAPTVLRPRRKLMRAIRRLAVAASVALVVAALFAAILRSPSVSFEDVEAAYSQMSDEDQDMIDFDFDDDIFLALTE